MPPGRAFQDFLPFFADFCQLLERPFLGHFFNIWSLLQGSVHHLAWNLGWHLRKKNLKNFYLINLNFLKNHVFAQTGFAPHEKIFFEVDSEPFLHRYEHIWEQKSPFVFRANKIDFKVLEHVYHFVALWLVLDASKWNVVIVMDTSEWYLRSLASESNGKLFFVKKIGLC